MPEYLSPGVYVEEIQSGPRPISAVATSTAGMAGVTRRGPDSPALLTSFADFLRIYGGPIDLPDPVARGSWEARGRWWHAAESVQGFFDEGGARLFFQRVESGAAVASTTAFNGGLLAGLESDVTPVSTTLTLTHVIGVSDGGSLTLVDAAGTALGAPLTVTAVNRTTRTVTLGGPAGVSARAGVDLAQILAVDTARAILTADAASKGAWGDDLSVRVLPVTTRLRLAATANSGTAVTTRTTAAAASGATTVTVAPVAGRLDATTATPFPVRLNGGLRLQVTGVAAAAGGGTDVTLTLGTGLPAAAPAGSTVEMLRPAVVGAVVTVTGAQRLYPDALVQLESATGAEIAVVRSVAGPQVTLNAPPAGTYQEGDWLLLVEAEVAVRYAPAGGDVRTELFSGLRLTADDHPQSLLRRVNAASALVRLTAGANWDGKVLQSFPASAGPAWRPLGRGDDALAGLGLGDFAGQDGGPGNRSGIQALQDIDEVAICLVPGMYHTDVLSALQIHCESLGDRFAVFDSPPGQSVQQVQAFRSPIDTTYAALYYPWVRIRDPRPGGDELTVPPSGFVAGIYARTDVARGVFKAPANEVLRSIRGLEVSITKREQDLLNPQNINVLRAFPGRGNRVWGARVLTSDPLWRYVPVRRLFLMIEESIDEATQWAVFEPNDQPLWAQIRQAVTAFLTSQWRIGALQGATAAEAFFVTCDRSTMSQDDIDNGRLICLIGIAPVKPAEFVIFRIQHKTLDTVLA
jgi:phage tail sheath protein FI